MEYVLFFLLAGAVLTFAVLVVFNRNPVASALFLVLVFFTLGGIYLLLQAEFIALIQVLVYAGAIMVLFLFVIMLLNVEDEAKSWLKGHVWQKMFGVIFALSVFPALALAVSLPFAPSAEIMGDASMTEINEIGNTTVLASLLFTKYVLPFEVTSVLLLAAMVGVAYITAKEKKTNY